MRHQSPQNFWTPIIILLALFFVIKWQGEHWTVSWYQNGNFNLLNFLAGTAENYSLDFYVGRVEEVLFGPLTILASGMAFLLYAVGFLQNAGHKKFCFIVFLYFAISRFDIVFFPPYGDAASGVFIEALWLLNHSFDYIGLSRQPLFVNGGPKVYLFSIYPTYLAVLMKIIPNLKLFFLINHFLVFLYGAIAITYFRRILLLVFNPRTSLLLSLLFLALPLVQSQVEAINMEMPILMFSLIAVYHLSKKNLPWAALFSILAALTKGTAIFVCGGVFAVSVYLFFFDAEKRFSLKTLGYGLGVMLFTALKLYAAFYILNEGAKVDKVGLWQGWPTMKHFKVTYLYGLSAAFFIGFALWLKLKQRNFSIRKYFDRHFLALVNLVVAGGWFLLFVHSFGEQYRYKLVLAPFCIICAFYALSLWENAEKFMYKSLLVLIPLFFWCSYGFLHTPSEVNDDAELERSLEYRNDLKLDMRLAKFLEENYSDHLISAPFTTAQILAFPELGYVTKKLNVMMYEFPCRYEGIREFKGLKEIDVLKTIWIWIKAKLPPGIAQYPEYPIGPYDVIVMEMSSGRRKATLFKGGVSIEKLRRITKQILKEIHIGDYLKRHGMDDYFAEE